MKKVILILTVILVSVLMWQCQSEDEVYMDEQIEVSEDLQKEGGLGEDIDPWGDDSAGGKKKLCSTTTYGGITHVVYEFNSYTFKCYKNNSMSPHTEFGSRTMAEYHCRNAY